MRSNTKDTLYTLTVHFLLIFTVVTVLFPLWHVFVISTSTETSYLSDQYHFIPKEISFREYRRALVSGGVLHSLFITAVIVAAGVFLSLLLTIPCAYALSKKRVRGRVFFLVVILITMYVDSGLIPKYLLVIGLGMRNSLSALVLPFAVSAYLLIIAKAFMSRIPASLEESAQIDGYSELAIFVHVVAPLSKPLLATVSVYIGVFFYNDYFNPLLYISNKDLFPFQYVLRDLIMGRSGTEASGSSSSMTHGIFNMACVILGILPIIAVYPFLQKYFVKGVMLGSIKE